MILQLTINCDYVLINVKVLQRTNPVQRFQSREGRHADTQQGWHHHHHLHHSDHHHHHHLHHSDHHHHLHHSDHQTFTINYGWQAIQTHTPVDGAFLTAASPGVVALFQVDLLLLFFFSCASFPPFLLKTGEQTLWLSREVHRRPGPWACQRVSLRYIRLLLLWMWNFT